MRFLVKVSFPVEAGNAAAKKDGFKVIQTILEQQKPEAAYFIAEGGRRTGILILILSPPRRKPGSIVAPHEPVAVVSHAIA